MGHVAAGPLRFLCIVTIERCNMVAHFKRRTAQGGALIRKEKTLSLNCHRRNCNWLPIHCRGDWVGGGKCRETWVKEMIFCSIICCDVLVLSQVFFSLCKTCNGPAQSCSMITQSVNPIICRIPATVGMVLINIPVPRFQYSKYSYRDKTLQFLNLPMYRSPHLSLMLHSCCVFSTSLKPQEHSWTAQFKFPGEIKGHKLFRFDSNSSDKIVCATNGKTDPMIYICDVSKPYLHVLILSKPKLEFQIPGSFFSDREYVHVLKCI